MALPGFGQANKASPSGCYKRADFGAIDSSGRIFVDAWHLTLGANEQQDLLEDE